MRSLILFLGILLAGTMARADRGISLPTAKQAVELVNTQLNVIARNQVVVVEGSDSNTDLRPRKWDITFFEAGEMNGGILVRVKDGAFVSKSTSVRMFDDARWNRFTRNFSGYEDTEVIKPARWLVDSDAAIKSALAHPKLAGLQVTAVRLTLRKPSDGDVPPVWRVKLRARSPQTPRRDRWVGHLEFNAENGQLLADELRVEQLTHE